MVYRLLFLTKIILFANHKINLIFLNSLRNPLYTLYEQEKDKQLLKKFHFSKHNICLHTQKFSYYLSCFFFIIIIYRVFFFIIYRVFFFIIYRVFLFFSLLFIVFFSLLFIVFLKYFEKQLFLKL